MAIRRDPCPRCKGHGVIVFGDDFEEFGRHMNGDKECSRCYGTGIDEYREGFEEMGVEEE